MSHPDEMTWLRYLTDDLGEADLLRADVHLAECPVCLEHVQTLRSLRSQFARHWRTWSAVEHGRAYRRWQAILAWQHVARQEPVMAARATAFVRRLHAGRTMDALVLMNREKGFGVVAPAPGLSRRVHLKIQIDRTRLGMVHILHLAQSGAGSGSYMAQTRADAASLPSSVPVEHQLEQAAQWLASGETESAEKAMSGARPEGVPMAQAIVWELCGKGVTHGRLRVDPTHGLITLQSAPSRAGNESELALLVPDHTPQGAVLAVFRRSDSADEYLATFERVGTGRFRVLW